MSLSNDKGAEFERSICQRLSLWVSNLTRQDVFWRSAMSGGRASLKARGTQRGEFSAQSGDITATHLYGHLLLEQFMVECKFYRSFEIHLIAFGKGKGEITGIWAKLLADAKRDGVHPMLVCKQNRSPVCIGLNTAGINAMRKGCVDDYDFLPHSSFPRLDLTFFHMQDMLTEVDFDLFRIGHGSKPLSKLKA